MLNKYSFIKIHEHGSISERDARRAVHELLHSTILWKPE